ncbi:probable E3 ubiquitin-protein ligase RHB1A isoform X1 [Euphorbia lathyris]|uniref:probable E3 ubiquitin-protein ligase RHB1A isoform X1 n=1 Tax=Euphorbia lathyris TaxID=212925 RepID=UPI003313FCCC
MNSILIDKFKITAFDDGNGFGSPDDVGVQDSESVSGGILDISATCESIDDLNCRTSASSLPESPKKQRISKLQETFSVLEEEDACPICLACVKIMIQRIQFFFTKCEHHL